MAERNVNYQKELDMILCGIKKEGLVPRLFLHSCCACCASYVLEYLSDYFEITVFFYNPNIFPEAEYKKRLSGQLELISEMKFRYPVSFIEGDYDKDRFYGAVKGLESLKEGGERCFKCCALRLRQTAKAAAEGGFDYFTTTLSVSPLKNAKELNSIGTALSREYNVKYLISDFKKKDGYKRSVQLSKEYGLYRQNYCGCEFSLGPRGSIIDI